MGEASKLLSDLHDLSEPTAQKMNTVGQTLALLRFLADAPAPMGVNAISRESNLPLSSCFRILKQLSEEGYAQFDRTSKCYSLGSAAVMLARRALDPANTFALIQPRLTRFAGETETSIGFWRRIDRNRIVLAGFVDSPHPMRIHISVGQRLPLYIGAVGRAFAGEFQLTDAELERELSQLRWQSPPALDEYRRQVREYARVGYATDVGNFAPGVTTVATVLRDTSGAASFGLSAIRISSQVSELDVQTIGTSLVGVKQEIERSWYRQG